MLASEAGLDIIELALGFVLKHRAVASVIIGPRTPEQLAALLPLQEIRLALDVLDAIDVIVSSGVTLNVADRR